MLSLAIQAGGQSLRMGQDKALKPFLGRPLIQRVVDRLSPIADEVFVTTNHPDLYTFLGLRLVPDLVPGLGSLGGIYTALSAASTPLVGIVACDLPFASAALLSEAARILIQEDVDLVLPRTDKGLEPLHAVYRREACLPVVRSAIDSNQLKAIGWLAGVRVREQTSREVASLDPSGLTFWNLNTPEEFRRAEDQCRGRP